MVQRIVNLGHVNGGDGDTVRDAFDKTNQNFTELYNLTSGGLTLPDQTNKAGKYLSTTGTEAIWSSIEYGDVANTPVLSTVAETGSYLDLTNRPTIPSLTGYATEIFVLNTVASSVNSVIDSAPGALNTLNELAAALGDDANFAATVTASLATKANTSSLSTVALSGSYNDLSNKPSIPTNTNQLTNGAGFITSTALTGYATESYVTTTAYTKTQTDTLLDAKLTKPANATGYLYNNGSGTFTWATPATTGNILFNNVTMTTALGLDLNIESGDDIRIQAVNTPGAGIEGGDILIYSGNGDPGLSGGDILIHAGHGGPAGQGGYIEIFAGNGVSNVAARSAGFGEDVTIKGGDGDLSHSNLAIAGISTTNPVVVTLTGHNLNESATVYISGIVGTTELNNRHFYVKPMTSDTFELYEDFALTVAVDGTGYTSYVSGGILNSSSNGGHVYLIAGNPHKQGSTPYGDYGTVSIQANGNTWKFIDTAMVFPDGTEQTTAFAGASSSLIDGTSSLVLTEEASRLSMYLNSIEKSRIQINTNDLLLSSLSGGVILSALDGVGGDWYFRTDGELHSTGGKFLSTAETPAVFGSLDSPLAGTSSGPVTIKSGSGNVDGGSIYIQAGTGGSGNDGEVAIRTGSTPYEWLFDNGGILTLPNSTTVGNDLAGTYSSSFLCLTWGVNDQTSGLFSSNGIAHPLFDPLIATVTVGWFVSGPGLVGVKEITEIVELGDGDRAFIVDLTDGSLWADLSVNIPYRFYTPNYALVYNGTRLTVNSNEWNFTQAGDLTIPGNINEKAGNDLEIAVHNNRNNDGTPGSAVLSLTNNDAVDYSTYTTLDVGAYSIKLNTDYTGVFTGSRRTWEFKRDGILTLPGGAIVDSTDSNFEVRNINNFNIEATSNFSVVTDATGVALEWVFDTNGILTFPGGATVRDLPGETTDDSVLILGAGTTIAENQRAARVAINGSVEGVAIGAGPHDWTFTNDGKLSFPGGGFIEYSSGLLFVDSSNIVIGNSGGLATWAFNSSAGSITFPNGSVQSTAWTGTTQWNDISGKPTFAAVATSGNYNDLINKPTIPTDISSFTDNTGLLSNIYVDGGDSSTEFDQTDLFLDGGGA